MDFNEIMSRFPSDLLESLKDTPQNPKWHPEGCVLNHIEMVYNLAQKIAPEDVDLQIAALFHDLGKPQTTKFTPAREVVDVESREMVLVPEKISSPDHEAHCKEFIAQYKHLFPEAQDWEKIAFICKHHMKMHLFQQMRPFKREELYASPYFHSLVLFAFCDDNGRGPGAAQATNL